MGPSTSLSPDDIERLLAREVRLGDVATDEFDGRDAEMQAYARRGRGRIRTTVETLTDRIRPDGRARLLELGADPWIMTQLIIEAGARPVSCSKRSGVFTEDRSLASPQRLFMRWGDHSVELEHHLFDAERDRWPFEAGAFDCVLCAELIEHLVFNPGHLLHEANRVLAPDGMLVLATPNAAAARKTALHLRGRNVHWAYSGYGAHGRHNREYTASELRALLSAAHFEATVESRNIAGYEADEPLGRALRALAGLAPGILRDRGDHLFAVARKSGPPVLATPDWLYRSFDRDELRRAGVLLIDEAT